MEITYQTKKKSQRSKKNPDLPATFEQKNHWKCLHETRFIFLECSKSPPGRRDRSGDVKNLWRPPPGTPGAGRRRGPAWWRPPEAPGGGRNPLLFTSPLLPQRPGWLFEYSKKINLLSCGHFQWFFGSKVAGRSENFFMLCENGLQFLKPLQHENIVFRGKNKIFLPVIYILNNIS